MPPGARVVGPNLFDIYDVIPVSRGRRNAATVGCVACKGYYRDEVTRNDESQVGVKGVVDTLADPSMSTTYRRMKALAKQRCAEWRIDYGRQVEPDVVHRDCAAARCLIRIGRRVLFRRQDLLDWLDQKRAPSPKE